jgi:hypothetical protein
VAAGVRTAFRAKTHRWRSWNQRWGITSYRGQDKRSTQRWPIPATGAEPMFSRLGPLSLPCRLSSLFIPLSHDALFRGALGGRLGPLGLFHAGLLSGRLISSKEGTWVLFHHDSSAAPHQTASPMRNQELCFSAFVLSATIASDNCRQLRNTRLRRAGSSRIVRRNQR